MSMSSVPEEAKVYSSTQEVDVLGISGPAPLSFPGQVVHFSSGKSLNKTDQCCLITVFYYLKLS